MSGRPSAPRPLFVERSPWGTAVAAAIALVPLFACLLGLVRARP